MCGAPLSRRVRWRWDCQSASTCFGRRVEQLVVLHRRQFGEGGFDKQIDAGRAEVSGSRLARLRVAGLEERTGLKA